MRKHLTPPRRPCCRRPRSDSQRLRTGRRRRFTTALNALAAELGVGLGKIAQPLRVAVTGTAVSPPIDATLALLGRERTLARLDAGIARCLGG